VWKQHAEEIEEYLDLFPFENPFGFAMSAGEKKLLDILRCLLLRPKLLLLDEPTAGLPASVRDRVMELVKKKPPKRTCRW
jgi:ABC-type branched-subunit amino acid transport system ATPase component